MAVPLNNFQLWIDRSLIQTQLWVSLNCAALGGVMQILTWGALDWIPLGVLFLVALVGYHFFQLPEIGQGKNLLVSRHARAVVWGVVLLGIFLSLFYNSFTKNQWMYFVSLSLASSLYELPKGKFSIRRIPYFKIVYIALMWSLWINGFVLGMVDFKNFLAIFFFVLAITIPFDIRDVLQDEKTWVSFLGVEKSIWLSLGLLWVSFLFFISLDWGWLIVAFALLFILFSIILLQVELKDTVEENRFYINFVVEGIPMLWLGILGGIFLILFQVFDY